MAPPMHFDTVRRNSAPEMVVRQFLQHLDNGSMQPGQKLPPQPQLAAMFGVGRSSVREAVNRLAVMGYLDIIQGKGTFVTLRPPTGDPAVSPFEEALRAADVLELIQARTIIECNAARLAAAVADPDSIEAIARAIAAIETSPGRSTAYLEADLDFHLAVAEACGNRVISEIVRLLLDKVHGFDRKYFTRLAGSRRTSLDAARRVLAAVWQGDGAAAADAMQAHLDLMSRAMERLLAPGPSGAVSGATHTEPAP